jgi:DNA-binding response OmpR family regulator
LHLAKFKRTFEDMNEHIISKIKELSILYAEDDLTTFGATKATLELFFKNVHSTNRGDEVVDIFKKKCPHVLLLDIEMPGLNGLEVAQKIREIDKNIPIVILTSYKEVNYLQQAIKLNLIDYLVKPLTLENLFSIMQDVISSLENNQIIIKNINENTSYDFMRKVLIQNEQEVKLSASEIACLELLLKMRSKLVTNDILYSELYEFYSGNDTFIKNLIYKIRKKLGNDSIVNVKNLGYILI